MKLLERERLSVDQVADRAPALDFLDQIPRSRRKHRRTEARVQALKRDHFAIGKAYRILVGAAVEAGHHHLGDWANVQGALQGLADALEAKVRISRHTDGGVAGLARCESH